MIVSNLGQSTLLLFGVVVLSSCGQPDRIAGHDTEPKMSSSHASGHNENGVSFMLSPDRLEEWKSKAVAGDNDAANMVANHYMEVGPKDEELRWRTLAAGRGDCYSIYFFKHAALDQGEHQRASHWNAVLREFGCTRDKAFPGRPDRMEPLWE